MCVSQAASCARSEEGSRPEGYTMSLDQVWETAGRGWTEAVTEFHIVGGLHPELTLDWYCQMLTGPEGALPAGAPEGVHYGRDLVLCAAAKIAGP
jgi:aminodeoxyfutalosine synthase